MADYYPLISRAVAGLEKNTGENRRALYERARAALLAQLRGVTPALSESDITRERLALEESIRKVEAESARQFVEPVRQPPAPKIRPIENRPPEPRVAEPRAAEPRMQEARPTEQRQRPEPEPRRYVNPPTQQETRTEAPRRPRPPSAPSMPDGRQSGSIFDQPLQAEPPPPPPPAPPPPPPARHPLRRPVAERRPQLSDTGLKDFRNVISEANELGGASARAEKSAREAYAAVPIPTNLDGPARANDPDRATRTSEDRPARSFDRPQSDRPDPRKFEQHAASDRMLEVQTPSDARPHDDFSEPMLESSFTMDDARPVAPRTRRGAATAPIEDEAEYASAIRETRPPRSYRPLIPGLIAVIALLVLTGVLWSQWSNMVALYRSFLAPATEVVRDTAAPASPKKNQDKIEPGGQQSAPVPTPGGQAAAVAQKVVLYEEEPGNPDGKRFVGSAIWRTETITPGPGQPPELAVRADVEVPERKLAMTWSFRRNTDKGLPATHTVEIMFKLPADFPSGGISNVPGILMKQNESTRGVPLSGLAVKVTPGFYLIGLSNLDQDRDRNLQLLKDRAWFDIPVVYNNNRRAILAMEKGTPGDRAFAEAFKAWKQ
jgi:hypothetical protein